MATLRAKIAPKAKLSSILRSWLPILQANIEELKDSVAELAKDNPYVEVKDGRDKNYDISRFFGNSKSGYLDEINAAKSSVYEELELQIKAPLFPTQSSQDMAMAIISCLNHEGYFKPDEKFLASYDASELERVRLRFAYLTPAGVGAKDSKEALLFALEQSEVGDEVYALSRRLIFNLEAVNDYAREPFFKEALHLIKSFQTPPFMDYMDDSQDVIADLIVYYEDEQFKVRLNEECYPDVHFCYEAPKRSKSGKGVEVEKAFISEYAKSAKGLIDALNLRKATLLKLGLLILEYQYDFFCGEEIKPMRLVDLAKELGRNQSTISRAISGKYLSCSRGNILLKNFFATQIEEGTSNAAVKEFVNLVISKEDESKPLSDLAILQMVEEQFGVKMVRRTITKYRKLSNIPSSNERKRMYELKGLL